MNIKINNTSEAKSDALVVLNSADSFESLTSTMRTIKISIQSNWADCPAKTSALNNLTNSIDYYEAKIIPALNKLGTSVDAYALATEQLAASSAKGGVNGGAPSLMSETNITPSEYAEATTEWQKSSVPNFENKELWYGENPYSQTTNGKNYIGQCTWFAWGRMKELYGFDPGFSRKGWQCTDDLVAAHPDKFYKSDQPVAGALFSTEPFNPADEKEFGHTGIILSVEGDTITYQEGNIDGWTNRPEIAETDWQTRTVTWDEFKREMGSMVDFANPYDDVEINW